MKPTKRVRAKECVKPIPNVRARGSVKPKNQVRAIPGAWSRGSQVPGKGGTIMKNQLLFKGMSPPETSAKNKPYTNTIFLKLRSPSAGTPPLAKPELLFKYYDQLYPLLVVFTKSPKRAEMLRYALKVQVLRGLAFCSAKRYAGLAFKSGTMITGKKQPVSGFASEKTWDRCLAFLKEHDLVDVERLQKLNGQYSVNLINFRKLWQLLLKLLAGSVGIVQTVGRTLWIKLEGAWFSRDMVLRGHPPRVT